MPLIFRREDLLHQNDEDYLPLCSPAVTAKFTHCVTVLKSVAANEAVVYGFKFIFMGLSPGITFFMMNLANQKLIGLELAIYFAIVGGAVNALGYTDYAGDLFIKLLKNVFEFFFTSNIDPHSSSCHKFMIALSLATVVFFASGAAAPSYSGLLNALITLSIDYTGVWKLINAMQYFANILMMSNDSFEWLAKQYRYYFKYDLAQKQLSNAVDKFLQKTQEILFINHVETLQSYRDAMVELDGKDYAQFQKAFISLTESELFQSSQKEKWFKLGLKGLALITAFGMLWAYNGSIVDVSNHPELGSNWYTKMLGVWYVAFLFNTITNGIFSFVNSQDGFKLMTTQIAQKAYCEILEASKTCAKWLAAVKNVAIVLGLWGSVISSVFGAVFLTFASSNAANTTDAPSNIYFDSLKIAPFLQTLVVLAAIEGFGINAKPIIKRLYDMAEFIAGKYKVSSNVESVSSINERLLPGQTKAQNALVIKNHRTLAEAACEGEKSFLKAVAEIATAIPAV